MKADTRSFYEVLGVDFDASPEQLKNAYRELIKAYHPDKHLHMSESFRKECEIELTKINAAYKRLSSLEVKKYTVEITETRNSIKSSK